jgi:hypothetical protein
LSYGKEVGRLPFGDFRQWGQKEMKEQESNEPVITRDFDGPREKTSLIVLNPLNC